MSRKLSVLSIAALVIIGMLATAGVAFAQGPVDNGITCPMYTGGGYGMYGGGYGSSNSMLYVVADLLETTPEALITEIQSGKTLLEIAEENGLTTDDLADAMLATRVDRLQAAVDAGRITQEQADLMIETMREQMLTQIGEGDCLGLAGTGTAYMGGRGARGGMMGGRMGGAYVDSDGDGVCDLYDTDNGASGTFGGRWNTQPGRTL